MAESVELGVAYLSLAVSTKSLKKSLVPALKELDVEAGKATQKSGNKLMAGVGGAIGKVAKVGALGIAGLGAAVVGLAAKGGISRALAIEDSEAKLSGLGHSAKSVSGIMADALASVKGTAFGLGEAASAAAGAVASGVKPGKDLQRTLKLTADAATIAGRPFSELSAIMNKAAASNKVQGDILAQLGDSGIPIVSLLGKEMKLSAAEVYKAGEDGAISFDHLRNAIESGMGGAALSSGKTFRGAWANTMAALGRGGETVIGPVLDLLRDGFNKAIPIIDSVTNSMKPFMASFTGKAPEVIAEITGGFRAFGEAFRYADGDITSSGFPGFMERLGFVAAVTWDVLRNRIIPTLIDLGTWIRNNRAWLEPLTVSVVAGAVAWKLYMLSMSGYKAVAVGFLPAMVKVKAAILGINAAMRANLIGIIITAVVALVAGFIYLWKTNEGFRNFFIGAWTAIKNVVGAVGGFIGGVFRGIANWVTGTLGPVFSWLYTTIVKPVWDAISGAIGTAGAAVGGVFGGIVDFIRNVLGSAFMWFRDSVIAPVMAGIQAVIGFAWNNVIQPIFAAMTWYLDNVLKPGFERLRAFLMPVWIAISAAVQIAWAIIETIFLAIRWALVNIVGPSFVRLYENVIKPMWSNIQSFISGAWVVIKAVFGAIVGFVKLVLGAAFTWLYHGIIKPIWNNIKSFISTAWLGIKAVFALAVSYIKTTLGNVFKWLYDYVIKPVWDGIKWYITTWWSGVKVVFNAVRDFIRDRLAPMFRWFRDSVIKPVWDGIKQTISNVWNNGIKPVFQALGNFIRDKVAPAFKKGVDAIKGIWNGIRNIAAAPINFVIDTVYNNGLRKALNAVRKVVGGDQLAPIPGIPAFAKGGQMGKGWKLVGEEGPELINTGPGFVHTAKETQAMLAGKTQAPHDSLSALSGASPGQAKLANGGWLESLGNAVKGVAGWVRGGLAKAAEALLTPLKDGIRDRISGTSEFGKTTRSALDSALAKTLSWIRGKDESTDAGGGFAGSYDGARGRFFRPSAGPYTSMFGPRWGAFHAGVDIAGGGKTFAALNGLVKYVGAGGGLPGRTGHGIRLDHGGGFETYYGHNPYNGVQVRPGDRVKAGQHIGYQGATGNVTGTHLHFETLQNGRALNPMSYLHDSGGWHAPGTMSYNGLKEPEAILTPSQWETAANAIQNQGGVSQSDLNELLTRLEDLANRPISVKVDSKEVAKATTAGRKELRLPPISPRG